MKKAIPFFIRSLRVLILAYKQEKSKNNTQYIWQKQWSFSIYVYFGEYFLIPFS